MNYFPCSYSLTNVTLIIITKTIFFSSTTQTTISKTTFVKPTEIKLDSIFFKIRLTQFFSGLHASGLWSLDILSCLHVWKDWSSLYPHCTCRRKANRRLQSVSFRVHPVQHNKTQMHTEKLQLWRQRDTFLISLLHLT